MSEFHRPQGLSSAVCYVDPKAAYLWLEEAFGFEPLMAIFDDQDNLVHSEMKFGNSVLMVGWEWNERAKSPKNLGGVNTQTVHVQLETDIDAHCERARKAGATIAQEPQDQFYGDRTYRCVDPEGHVWTFGQTLKALTPDEWDAASGLKTRTRV